MGMHLARAMAVERPWGVSARHFGFDEAELARVGEVRYEAAEAVGGGPGEDLGLKLILTGAPVSVEVRPPAAERQAEATYVVQASEDARVAHGLREPVSADALRRAVEDRTLPRLLRWLKVEAGDVLMTPPGTLHSAGPGIVMVEVASGAADPLSLFDYGGHGGGGDEMERALEAARLGPAPDQDMPDRVDAWRTLLVATPGFVFERLDLPARSGFRLEVPPGTWLLCIEGYAVVDRNPVATFAAVRADGGPALIEAGGDGAVLLCAYPGGDPLADLVVPAGMRG